MKWCGDLTEIPTDEGKLYLATSEDLASRRLPGFAMGEHHDAPLATAALCMAAAVRGGDIAGVIFIPTRAAQHTSFRYTDRPHEAGIAASIGSVGDSYDNTMAEALNGTFKSRARGAPRTVAQPRPVRTRRDRLDRLVQHPPTPQRDR